MYDFSYNNQGSAVSLVLKLGYGEDVDSLSMGMMMNNKIPGFLPVSRRYIDNDMYLYYDVSSLAPMPSAYHILCQDKYLIHFLLGFCHTVKECGEYLLDSKNLCLLADYVYIQRATGEFRAVYLPVDNTVDNITPYEFVRDLVSKIGEQTYNESVVMPVLYRLVIAESMFSVENLERQLTELQTSGKLRVDTRANMTAHISADSRQTKETHVQKDTFIEGKNSFVTPIPPQSENIQDSLPVRHEEIPENNKEENGFMKMLGGLMGSAKSSSDSAKKEKSSSGLNFGGLMSKKKTETASNGLGFDNPFSETANSSDEMPVQETTVQKNESSLSFANPFGKNSEKQNEVPAEKQEKHVGKKQEIPSGNSAVGGGYTLSLDGMDSGASLATSLMIEDAGSKSQIALVRRANGQRTIVAHNNFHIGRGQNLVDLYIDTKTSYIGSDHAYIVIQGREYFVVDNNSKNHTWLNGNQLECSRPYAIHPGDILRFADEYFDVTEA